MAVVAPLSGKTPLGREEITGFVDQVSVDRPQSLSGIWLASDSLDTTDGQVVAVCFPLMVRAGGFMIITVDLPAVREALLALSSEGDLPEAVFWEKSVDLVTSRGCHLGSGEALLVDLDWGCLGTFYAPVTRGAALASLSILQFTVGAVVAKPSAGAALHLAEEWLSGGDELDAQTAQEYLSGVELVDAGNDEELEPGPSGQQADREAVLERIAQLEAELTQARASEAAAKAAAAAVSTTVPSNPTVRVGRHGAEQQLFEERGPSLTQADLTRLQRLAGPPPGNLKRSPKQRAAPSGRTALAETAYAEVEKEVVEDEDLQQVLVPPTSTTPLDPVQQMLLAQMQQNQLLLQKMLGPRGSQEQMTSLLSGGGGSESGSSSGSGARGCMARDMYLKTVQDLPRVAEVARLNALQELGITADREDKDLMHLYIERRVPLSENKLLAHFAVLAAEAWSIAHGSNNIEMKGFLARVLFVIEQVALDGGKLELGWLLGGFPEPNTHLHFSVKRTPGLKPFSRLVSPIWLSANLAFLRDLDYMQGRIQTIGTGKQHVATGQPQEESDAPNPKRRPRPKKKQKGGKGGDSAESAQ